MSNRELKASEKAHAEREKLAGSDWWRDKLAEAWDEGWNTGWDANQLDEPNLVPNPYRVES